MKMLLWIWAMISTVEEMCNRLCFMNLGCSQPKVITCLAVATSELLGYTFTDHVLTQTLWGNIIKTHAAMLAVICFFATQVLQVEAVNGILTQNLTSK